MELVSKFIRRYWWAILLSIIILAAIILCYFSVTFFLKTFESTSLSKDSQKWAEFGDYFSGTLNTLFTLINVCVTIWLTITINRLAERNAEKQIEAEKQVATIQIRHEALKELRKGLNEGYKTWKSDLNNPKLGINCQDQVMDFSNNYSYLFDDQTIEWCNDLMFKINHVVLAIRDNPAEVNEMFFRLYSHFLNFFSRVEHKIIQ